MQRESNAKGSVIGEPFEKFSGKADIAIATRG
jgi:hypothetical protein